MKLSKPDLFTTISYMKEAGWCDGDVYVVWLNGATDGWPAAIFNNEGTAECFVNIVPLNPEGYLVEKISFITLCDAIMKDFYSWN